MMLLHIVIHWVAITPTFTQNPQPTTFSNICKVMVQCVGLSLRDVKKEVG